MQADPRFNEGADMSLRDYVRVLFKHKWALIMSFIITVAVVWAGLQLQTPHYEATVKMLITAQKQLESPYYKQITGNQSDEINLTQTEIVKSKPVLDWVVNALNLQTRSLDYEKAYATPLKAYLIERNTAKLKASIARMPPAPQMQFLHRRAVAQLKGKVTVEPIRDTNLFTITVSDVDPVLAARTANLVARSYIIFDLKQQLVEVSTKYGNKHPKVMVLNEMIKNMSRFTSGEPVTDIAAIGPASVKVMEQASVPVRPSGRSQKMILALAAIMGLFLGVVLAFVFEYSDQSVRGPSDIERELDVPHLGSVVKKNIFNSSVNQKMDARSAYAESYRQLADQLYLMLKDKESQTLMLAAPGRREGNTVTALNLAKFFADYLELKVLLVDANMRNPGLRKLIKNRSKPGFAELAAGTARLEEAVYPMGNHLEAISGGRTELNPITIFELSNTDELIAQWKKEYDLVIFDAPNFRDYKDAYLLSEKVDQTVLVFAQGATRRRAARYIVDTLRQRKANILGAILTERKHYLPKFIYDRV